MTPGEGAVNWQDFGSCRDADPDLFFPDKDDRSGTVRAKAVCLDCPVNGQCLDFALRTGPKHGIWAGMTPDEIAAIRD